MTIGPTQFAVVIPYFQRSPGILTRALDSVVRQTLSPTRVLIIDDSSPQSAAAELAGIFPSSQLPFEVHLCSNRGPGGARNVGLDLATRDAQLDAVAFLDSDDVWEAGHLARAAQALSQGDFYFSDYSWPSRTSTRFRQTGLFNRPGEAAIDENLRLFGGDFGHEILSSWPVHTSALCIALRTLGHIRFDQRFTFSSEDQHYFLQCTTVRPRIYYDCELGMRLDDGLNIYRRRKSGDFEFSRSKAGNAYFHRVVAREMTFLSEPALRVNRKHILSNVRDFAKSEVSGLRSGRLPALSLWKPLFGFSSKRPGH